MKSSRPLPLFFSGFLIGAADLIPGISGGTVALILGLYPQLIIHLSFIREGLHFLAPLLSGVVLAVLSLSPLLAAVLRSSLGHTLLYSALLALLIGAIVSSFQRGQGRTLREVVPFLIGAGVTLIFIGSETSNLTSTPTYLWMGLSAAFAICATLLPGISGSLVLAVFGTYTVAIDAVAHFFVRWEAVKIVAVFAGGIAFGALCFVRIIRWLLDHFPLPTMAALNGCMAGAIPVLWPFRGAGGVVRIPQFTSGGDLVAIALFTGVLATLFFLRDRGPAPMSNREQGP